jgi:hypothetical protein
VENRPTFCTLKIIDRDINAIKDENALGWGQFGVLLSVKVFLLLFPFFLALFFFDIVYL